MGQELTRNELIEKGKIWIVYPDNEPDNVLFEGNHSKCKLFIAETCPTAYKSGKVRLAKIIYEPVNQK